MAEHAPFELLVTLDEQEAVVVVRGELDLAAAPRLRECLFDLRGRLVRIDCSEVTFMDSTALGVLIAAQHRTVASGGDIVLEGVRPAQIRLFEITGLTSFLHADADGDRNRA